MHIRVNMSNSDLTRLEWFWQGLEAIVMTQTQLKAAVLQATNGQRELQAMDDQIPLFIFVLLASDLTCPSSLSLSLFQA